MSHLEKLVNNERLLETMLNLKDRWQDEKAYEDFADYVSVVLEFWKREIRFAEFIDMDKRFRVTFRFADAKMVLFIKSNRRGAFWFACKLA